MRRFALLLLCLLPTIGLAAPKATPKLTLTSSSFRPGGHMQIDQESNKGTCGGGNQSPGLKWNKAPRGTRSFAVTMYDEDKDLWHWVVVNIPPTSSGIPEGGPLSQATTEIKNSFKRNGYTGMCPPPGEKHRYRFTLWALKVGQLKLTDKTSTATALQLIRKNALATTTLTGTYRRQ